MLQVLNLTDLELNRVDIRVGLSGALYFMDGSPQAIRQLRNLVSQVFFPTFAVLLGFSLLPLWCILLFFPVKFFFSFTDNLLVNKIFFFPTSTFSNH
jgi:hypothetical protein